MCIKGEKPFTASLIPWIPSSFPHSPTSQKPQSSRKARLTNSFMDCTMNLPLLKITTSDEEGCAYLSEKIHKLTTIIEDPSGLSFSTAECVDAYTLVFDLCTKRGPYEEVSQPVYDHYKKLLEEYIELIVFPSLKKEDGVLFLREFVMRRVNYNVMVRWLLRIFEYIDRHFVPRNKLPTLEEVASTLFCDKVFDEFKCKAKDVVITLIEQEREGEQIDHGLIKQVLTIFLEVGGVNNMKPYEDDFEAHLLENITSYYSKKASSHIYIDSCTKYMLMAEECLKGEKSRASHYLHSSSIDKLLEKIQHELLLVNVNQLLEKKQSGLQVMLQDGKHLERMFNIFSNITEGLDTVAMLFEKHVTKVGMALVKEVENATSDEQGFIRKVIKLNDKYTGYVKNCFMDNALLAKALKQAFEIFCNKSIAGISMPELLATSCDNILKKGGGYEKLGDGDMEEMLEKVVMLLTYVNQKDIFAEFYRKKLASRLLFDGRAGDDREMFILSKLKQQWGSEFTFKMEGMVMDSRLAREGQENFENYLVENLPGKSQISMKATILTRAFWPTYKPSDLHIPAEMRNSIEVFTKFYESKNHRKLTWIFSLGTCKMVGRFRSKAIRLRVTTSQAIALLLFNTSDRLSYQGIKSHLNLTDEDVTRLLHSLSCAKYKILNKEPNTMTISSTDIFEFNAMFTSRMRKIEIPLPLVEEEKKEVLEDVNKDRRYTIDASLVRIMKSQKTLDYQQLVMECEDLLNRRFKPDIKAIKERIETLIELEFLARDGDDPKTIVYVS
ncbi:hypothetical protein MRB53_010864 [Persea americana]|uniref:Uncharacterized protein n=1 Tax=Persea americana TaxID=3435 RepID=A0ACC2LT17_PERAE|nr:hypothetical protein MRB53_010864 [Persea americana]